MLRRHDEAEQGFTLIELLVAVFLVGVIGAVVTAGVVRSLQTTRQDQNRADSASQLRTAIDRFSRDVRASNPLRAASATALTLDEERGGACVRTYYRLAGTSLDSARTTYSSLDQCKLNAAAPVPTTGWTTVVDGVDLATSSFLFYDDNVSANAVTPTPTTLATLTRVGITVVRPQAENRAATRLSTTIDLRNPR